MNRVASLALVSCLGLVLPLASQGSAQEEPKPSEAPRPATPRPSVVPTLLRVQIAISRHQGEKKIASVPSTLLVTTDNKKVSLRMGVEVPIAVTTGAVGQAGPPVTSFQYRNVGTNIDCRAADVAEGLFQLNLDVESSSVYTSPSGSPAGAVGAGVASERPFFRTFNVSLSPVLRDGQTVQAVASTDPITGEVVRIEASLTVVKER
jgi:type II/III secretion system protein